MTNDTGGPAFPQPDLSGYGMGPPQEGQDGKYQVTGMTLRQYAAIKLRVPDSGTDWLDAMILEGRLLDYAGNWLCASRAEDFIPQGAASEAFTFARAMLAERAKG